MRQIATRLAFAAVLFSLCAISHAKHPKMHRGVPGTVTEVNKQYFTMDLDKGGYFKVFCTANTNFEFHAQKGDASHVKVGVRVRITGATTDGSVVDASLVNVIEEGVKNPETEK